MRPGAGIAAAALLVALAGCRSRDERASDDPPPPPAADPGGRAHEARAVACIEAKDWECAASNLSAAAALATQPPTETRKRLATALAAEAKVREKAIPLARPGRDRLVAAQDADALWTLWAEVTGKPLPASAKRVKTIVSREAAAAARQVGRDDAPPPGPLAPARQCCTHCTNSCPCGDTCIACSQKCLKAPGCAC